MNMNEPAIARHIINIDKAIDAIGNIILGKENAIRLALTCLIAKGHLLIEDTPGVGKTTLAHTLAKVLGLDYQRIQFTSDLLPADILGVSVYNRDTCKFNFHPGPIFSNIILADEINRATPRTQSALLEPMAEHQVTVESETRDLPELFFVIATQNPTNQIGTFPLPESQLDRFLMCIELGYPDNNAERELLKGKNRKDLLADLQASLSITDLLKLQQQVEQVHVSDAILDYLQSLLDYSRTSGSYIHGLSPRAGIAILSAAKAWAVLNSQQYILPEDVQAVLPSVIGHRLQFVYEVSDKQATKPAEHLIQHVVIP
ncbi:MAG TPA: MoxR family ATPase [Thiotrichaceae bacterium]|nr:MoxR family ATPase [Thiotrichaceae bacterium]HIM07117.1 MoxR family ATPase [Gammaproteobacteria bacterium]